MMSAKHSGVIACHSISTTRPEATPQKSVPFKAWPAITDWLTYHTLPTINALYRPDVLPNPTDVESIILPPGWSIKEFIEYIMPWFPSSEEFMSQLMPQFQEYLQGVGEYYESNFGIENAKQDIQQYLANILESLGDHNAIESPLNNLTSITEGLTKILSPEDTFSTYHEIGHFFSLGLTRPAITQFKATGSAIEDLLQQVATGEHEGFWNEFTDLNDELGACLINSLEFEELRADLFALDKLPLDMQTTFINKIYGEEREDGINKKSEVFYNLQFLTGGRLMTAVLLTILAECLDPSDPVSQLEQVQNSLKVESAHTWSDEQWNSWFQQWYRLDTWETLLSRNEEMREKTYTKLPNATLSGRPDGNVIAACTKNMQLPVFHESMRQQLFCRKQVRTLICPFKGRHRSCCGFGHYLRNIWAAIPNEDKRRLKPPSQVCLKYSP